ncbi:MAG: hypothetical protein IT307_19755 [Chloroflexi bacterium]|nr:hypothetical protein [Chloroflexota bacterium]
MGSGPRFDLGRAFLALALAIALWWTIESEQNPERFELLAGVPIEVTVVNIPPGFVLVGEQPTIQVEVRAPTRVWSRLRSGSFQARVDASRAGPGATELAVSVDALDTAVTQVTPVPARVNVVLEEVRERTVPVQVVTTGSVPFGYSSGEPTVAPEQISVLGPASVVQRVDRAMVELSLSGLTVPVNNSYAPVAVDQRGQQVQGIRLRPVTVNVEIPISQQVSYKQVGIRPRTTGRPQTGYFVESVDVSPISVTIVGEPGELSKIDYVDTEDVDVSSLSSTAVRRVALRVPRNVALLSGSEPQVNVTVKISSLTSLQVVRVTPAVLNLSTELRLDTPPPLVEAELSGPAPTLQALSTGGLRVIVDLSGLGAGLQTVPVAVEVPPGIQLNRVTPDKLTLNLVPIPVRTPTVGATSVAP